MKIQATPNYSKKHFTLRTYNQDGELIRKYRTIRYSKSEFDSNLYNTDGDWLNVLNTTDEYYKIK